MAIRSSLSFLLALSSLVLVNSIPVAIPMPLSPGVPSSSLVTMPKRNADPSPTFPDITNNVGNAMTGAGGHAAGGSVTGSLPIPAEASLLGLDNLHLLKIGSSNGGNAGEADSGPAIPASNTHVSVKDPVQIKGHVKHSHKQLSAPKVENYANNANSGPAGNADGGSAVNSGAVLDVLSGNAGDGNSANSGASGAGLAGMHLIRRDRKTAVQPERPRSIAFRKHAVSRKARLSRMAYPYR